MSNFYQKLAFQSDIHYRGHSRTTTELKAISKEIRFNKLNEIPYHAHLVEFDQSDDMKRHRANVANSRIAKDKSNKHNDLSRDVSYVLDSKVTLNNNQTLQAELINCLGFESPETMFGLSNNIEEIKKQVKISNFDLTFEKPLGIPSENYKSFIRAGIGKNNKYLRPSGKKDIEALEHWLNFMLQQILQTQTSDSELFQNAQIIYSAALLELIRQIGVNCLKRAEILERVWKAYFSLMVNAIQTYEKSKISFQGKTNSDSKIAESKSIEYSNKLLSELNELKSDYATIQSTLTETKRQLNKSKYQEKLIRVKYSVLLAQYEKEKIRLIRIEDTNGNLNNLLKTVLDDLDTEMPGMKKLREKNKIRFRDISKILMADPFLVKTEPQNEDVYIPEDKIEETINREKAELENKIFLQEIKEKIEETEEEMFDKTVDTSEFVVFNTFYSQTELDKFVNPVVSVENQAAEVKKIGFEEIILKIVNNQHSPDDKEMEKYFSLENLDKLSDSDYDELSDIQEDVINEISDDKVTRLQISGVIKMNHEKNLNKYETIKKRLKRCRNKVKNLNEHLTNMRKALYQSIKENLSQKSKTAHKTIKKIKKKKIKTITLKPEVIKKRGTIIKEFSFNRRESRKIVQNKESSFTPAGNIIKQIISGSCTEKLTLSKKSLIKIMNSFITEYSCLSKEVSATHKYLFNFFYIYITSKYTNKKVGNSNYTQFILGCDNYGKTCKQIYLFGRFLGLFEPLKIKFFGVFIELTGILLGISKMNEILIDENDEILISLYKCEEATEIYWKNKISNDEHQILREKLQKSIKQCPKGFNLCGVIDKYDFIEINIKQYSQYSHNLKNNVKELFEGADISGNDFLNFEEFDLLFRNIEKLHYSEFYSKLLFKSYSDLIAENNGKEIPTISYNKFSLLCTEKGLFKIETQNAFLKIKKKEDLNKFLNDLSENKDKYINQIKWRLSQIKEGNFLEYSMINLLNKKLEKDDYTKPVFISFKLLDEDTIDKIVNLHVQNVFPSIVDCFARTKKIIGVDRNPIKRETRRIDSDLDSDDDT